MSYRVRTPEGEMEYGSLYDIANALRHGLVEGDDELLVPGQTTWVRVADHSALRAHVRPGAGLRPGSLSHWSYWVVAGALVVAVWLSTRLALRAARVRSGNRVDSRRR